MASIICACHRELATSHQSASDVAPTMSTPEVLRDATPRCEAGRAVGFLLVVGDGGRVTAADFGRDLGPIPGVQSVDASGGIIVAIGKTSDVESATSRVLASGRKLGLIFTVENIVVVADDCTVTWQHPITD